VVIDHGPDLGLGDLEVVPERIMDEVVSGGEWWVVEPGETTRGDAPTCAEATGHGWAVMRSSIPASRWPGTEQ
jgi:hypothetical protein